MSAAVQEQTEAGKKAVQDVVEMKEAVRQLFSKISDVKFKASQSEVCIIHVCLFNGRKASFICAVVVPLVRLGPLPIVATPNNVVAILVLDHLLFISCSKEMVQEICRDIRLLDTAKRHIQATVTALRRLHMLIAAVKQLELAAHDKRFREAANLLDAVQQLLTHFDSYSSVPRITELRMVWWYAYVVCPSPKNQ